MATTRTFDEKGPGRKHCPSCEKYVGNRTAVCVCEHVFTKDFKAAAPKGMQPAKRSFDAPGAGRKQCPKCTKFVGNRSLMCVCRHVFEKRSWRQATDKDEKAERPKFVEITEPVVVDTDDKREKLAIPAGRCPIALESTDEEAVYSWIEALISRFSQVRLLPSAVRYYARTLFGTFSDEYREVDMHIDSFRGWT